MIKDYLLHCRQRLFSLAMAVILISTAAYGQQAQVSGKVVDDLGEVLPGVTVQVKGTQIRTLTDAQGSYQLSALPANSTLVFTYLGMKTREVPVSGRAVLNVTLEGEAFGLEEVVAIGYGTVKKKDLTGSVSTVTGEELAQRNTTQLSQALQGTMPGVTVTRSNSEPGAAGTIRVRGITTIGENDPLVIVDGVPVRSIDDVNSQDIEDISVLKDAASASIYGARAAAGVVLITTRRAKTDQVNLDYQANFGIERPTRFPESVGPQRYLEMVNEFTWNGAGNAAGGQYGLYPKDVVDNWLSNNASNPNRYPITDWIGLIVNDYAPKSNHNLSFTGGSAKVKTRASLNYENVDALYDHKTFERVTARANNTVDISNTLSANVDFSFNYTVRTAPTVNPIWDAIRYPVIFPAMWADGRIASGQNGSNDYAALHFGGFSDSWNTIVNGRISLQYKPTKDLAFTAVVAPHFYGTKGKTLRKRIDFYTAEDPTVLAGNIAGYNVTNLAESRNDGKSFTKQFLANYNKQFNSHRVNLIAGYEDSYSFDESLTARGDNYTLTNFPYLNLAPLDFMSNGGNAYETSYQSFFGRALYDYKNKYLLQANLRYDGSSRLHPDYRWGGFPSVSAGWVLSEESFFPKSKAFSYLKLRASWGLLGNERIGNYPYQSSIGYSNSLFYQGNNVVSATTAAQFAYAIQDITWETTQTKEIAFDTYFLNDRLMLTAGFFQKETRDMLLELEIPDYMGFENPQQNTGKMYTKGWDAQATWRDRVGKFNYSASFNMSDSKSRMGDLGGIVFDGAKIIRQGTEYNEWYGYVSNGLYQTAQDVAGSPKLYSSVAAGDVKYLDVSGPNGVPDGKITPDYDRVSLGGSLPRYVFGGILNANYSGFDLSVAFQGVGKQNSRLTPEMVKPFHSAWTTPPAFIDGNYWSVYNTPEQNLAARYPRLASTSAENNNYVMSDYWLFKGGYFRLKNIVLGYTLPSTLTSKAKISQVRIFAAATDLFSVDKYPTGWDPETTYSSYISKSFNFGLSVKF